MVKNYNKTDTRCGAILELKMNCNYVMEQYAERHGYGELIFRGHTDDEDITLEEFWIEYNQRIIAVLFGSTINLDDDQGRDIMVDEFDIHLDEWKVKFYWRLYDTDVAENREYCFPDGKSWEEYYDTYEEFLQKQINYFQLFVNLVPLGLVKDPILKPVVEKAIADAKDALSKCPNKTAVIIKEYWENEEEEEPLEVEEININGKKYLIDRSDNELFDWLKYMETGEALSVGFMDYDWPTHKRVIRQNK